MATTRDYGNGFKLIDWTDAINNTDNQAGLIGSMNLYRTQGISQTAVVFDKSMNDTTLLPQVSRRAGDTTKGIDRKFETFSLPLAYFKHSDYITPEDIQAVASYYARLHGGAPAVAAPQRSPSTQGKP